MMVMLMATVLTSTLVLELIISFFYLTNPLFCFYVANFNIIIDFVKRESPDFNYDIPLAFGMQSTFLVSITCFAFQNVMYMLLTQILDYKRSRQFRNPRNNKAKIVQPRIEQNTDILIHEEIVTENNKEDEWMLRAVDLEMIYPGNGLKAVSASTFGV